MAKKIPSIIKEVKSLIPPPIDYSYQKNISHSQITTHNQCTFRWKLHYKDKIKLNTSTIHTIFGTAIHEVIQDYLEVFYSESKTKANKMNLGWRLEKALIKEYTNVKKSNGGVDISNVDEIREFFNDGVEILKVFKSKIGTYFGKRGWYLIGCELPITLPPSESHPNILFLGYLDIVLYHEPTDTFKIIDLKTSTRGWKDKDKKDESKQNQIILYKTYFSTQYKVPIDKVKVEFIILKRKIYEESDYPQSRIQVYSPASGKIKIKKAKNVVDDFISKTFKPDGTIKERLFLPNPGKWNCRFCPYKDTPHCTDGL